MPSLKLPTSIEYYDTLKALAADIRFIRDKYDNAFKNIDNKSNAYLEEITELSKLSMSEFNDLKELGFKEIQDALKVLQNGAEYKEPNDPHANINPHKKGVLWINTSTGICYVCTDNTKGANIWSKQSDFTYNQNDEPKGAKLDETWFHPQTGIIYTYKRNEKVKFVSPSVPEGAAVDDIWFKCKKEDIYSGEYYIYKLIEKGNAWIKPELYKEKAHFKQDDEPSEAALSSFWYKPSTDELFVRVLSEGKLGWSSAKISKENAQFIQEDEPSDATLGQFWARESTGEIFIYAKLSDELDFVKMSEITQKAYIFTNNSLQLKTEFEEIKKDINKDLTQNQTNIGAQIAKLEKLVGFKPVRISQNSGIDLSLGNVFLVDAKQVPNLKIIHVPDDKIGSSGVICIYNCQNLKSFDAKFKWRISQTGFNGSEVFAYFVHDKNWIRIVRS